MLIPHGHPLVWVDGPLNLPLPEITDTAMHWIYQGTETTTAIKSWGHDDTGVHWLSTRNGTALHTDRAYTRYTHHLLLRNDGWRIRGKTDQPNLIPALTPGHLYCLDTWQPHQVVADTRLGPGKPVYKLQLIIDHDQPLQPREVLELLAPRITDDPTRVPATPPRRGRRHD